jgi:hypothetical protein
MDSPMEKAIRYQLGHYFEHQISLNQFRLWLMPLLWTIDRENDAHAFETASTMALYLAEYGAGHRAEKEMRVLLGPFVLSPPMHEDRSTLILSVPGMPSAWSLPAQASPLQVPEGSGRVQTIELDRPPLAA